MIDTFNWQRVRPPMGDFACSSVSMITFHAPSGNACSVRPRHEEQTSGNDINEAMQRAQAAAIVQHDLGTKSPNR